MVQDGAKKRPRLDPDEDTAPVVRRIFDMAEARKGMLDIAKTLNDEGFASPAGRRWSKTVIHNMLSNEAYTGTLLWGVSGKGKAEPVRVENAFPGIISKAQFRRVSRLMRSRAPKETHPRRVGSTYMLSGLVKCKACNRAFSGQDAKSGRFSYYVCQSIMKHGAGACDSPRINARRFEEMVISNIRSNILTDGNIRALVKVVDERMDGVATEQRQRLETIEDELGDVKRKLGRIWHYIESTDKRRDGGRLGPHPGTQGPAVAPGGRGVGGQSPPLPAQRNSRRRGDHCGLRPGHERAHRAQVLYRDLRQGDRHNARKGCCPVHCPHAGRQPDSKR